MERTNLHNEPGGPASASGAGAPYKLHKNGEEYLISGGTLLHLQPSSQQYPRSGTMLGGCKAAQ